MFCSNLKIVGVQGLKPSCYLFKLNNVLLNIVKKSLNSCSSAEFFVTAFGDPPKAAAKLRKSIWCFIFKVP